MQNMLILWLSALLFSCSQQAPKNTEFIDIPPKGSHLLDNNGIAGGDTLAVNGQATEADTISKQEEIQICRNIDPGLKNPNELLKAGTDKYLKLYKGIHKTAIKYTDSSMASKLYIKLAYSILELNYQKAEMNETLPVSLKLELASIKSEIHTLFAGITKPKPLAP